MLTTRVENEIKHHQKIAVHSEKIWGRLGLAGKLRLERRQKMIANFCRMDSSTRVLEIGCGTGLLTEYLAETRADIIATDIFPEFIELNLNKNKNHNVTFKVANAETLEEFSEQNFDVICGLSVLHHLDVDTAFKNIFRALKTGGRIAFSEPNMLNPQIALQKNIPLLKEWLGDSPDETAFFKWQIKKDLSRVGFKNISVEPFDFLHPAMPDFLVKPLSKADILLEKIPFIKEIAGSLFIYAEKH